MERTCPVFRRNQELGKSGVLSPWNRRVQRFAILEGGRMYVVSSNGQANCLEVPEMSLSRQRVPMTVFFLFAFGVPWGAMIIARIRHVALPEATLSFMIAAVFCSIGGVVATYVAAGRAGLKELGLRCVLYRVGVSRWLYALFLAPCVYAVATVIYGVAHGKVGPVSPMELLRTMLVRSYLINTFNRLRR